MALPAQKLGVWKALIPGSRKRKTCQTPLYHPLEPRQSRLVRVEYYMRNKWDLQFKIVDLDNLLVEYIAFSYCWGDPTRVAKVSFGDGQTLPITKSVTEILSKIIHLQSKSYFWMDLLSINQDDVDEKGKQVSMIAEIFSRASRVDAWLGAVQNGDEAIDFLHRLYKDIDDHAKATGEINKDVLDLRWRKKSYDSELWKLVPLLQNPFFRRIWILQEVARAPKGAYNLILHCNETLIPWGNFTDAIYYFSHNLKRMYRVPGSTVTQHGLANLWKMNELRLHQEKGEIPCLAHELIACTHFEANDMRDKVYALMSMCQRLEGKGLVPDYKASTEDVYIRTQYTLLVENHSFDSLVGAGIGFPRNIPHLPSWATDWSYKAPEVVLDYLEDDSYRACGTHQPHIKADNIARRLSFKGVVIDFVSSVPRLPFQESNQDGVKQFDRSDVFGWINSLRKFVNISHSYRTLTNEEKSTLIIRTISANSFHNVKEGTEKLLGSLEARETFLELLDASSAERNEETAKLEHFVFSLVGRGLHHQFTNTIFTTENHGLLGLGPRGLQKDDLLCILYGLRIPCLLRPHYCQDPGAWAWKFVGVCYVDNIMDGKGLEIERTEDWAQELEFTLV